MCLDGFCVQRGGSIALESPRAPLVRAPVVAAEICAEKGHIVNTPQPSDTTSSPMSRGTADRPRPMRKLGGLFTRRERWGLSRKGWLAFLAVVIIGTALFVSGVVPFLKITDRIDANILVVEGWVHPFAIRAAVEEFNRGSYQFIVTTGGPVQGTGAYTNDFNTSASVGAERLIAAGVPAHLVQMAPARSVTRDRTYSSAVALRMWLGQKPIPVKGINVLTEDVHARRTWLLFQKALGEETAVGIIAVQNPEYDPKTWWKYSEGVREVLGESIAYIYARFFFRSA
jgi:hypothetical protein